MSMHVIEDLVEGSIRVLHAVAPAPDGGVRDRIAVLYDFQDGYDCSFTHFRVMEILLARRFSYRFAVSEHPEYDSRRAFFDGLTDFTALGEGDADWLDQGYVDPPHLYCDAGTALWRTMVGDEPLRRVPLAQVVLEVVRAAEKVRDVELIAMWHALGYQVLADVWVEEPRETPAVREIHDIAHRTGAAVYDLPDGLRPPPEYYDDDPIESWWYAG
ncbi:hypothetical protein [Nocardia sp. NPDC048505]|uniref:hypothetical protein n=1 Tax=unclassified Nocardia TaxID=2637762 RepID=UPI0033E1132C